MARYYCENLVILLTLLGHCRSESVHNAEPVCTSRFDFEEKLLQKMVKMEHAMDLLKEHVTRQLADLESEKNGLLREFTDLKESVSKNKDDVMGKITNLESRFEDFSENVNKAVEQAARSGETKVVQDEPIVFSVTQAEPSLKNSIAIFTKVLVNEGNAYNLRSGKFRCPVDGIYSFSFTIRSSDRGFTYCSIRKNGSRINYAISEGVNDLGSITVHAKLKTGDVIDVGSCSNWGNYAGDPTSFSGYLMYRL